MPWKDGLKIQGQIKTQLGETTVAIGNQQASGWVRDRMREQRGDALCNWVGSPVL